MAQRPGHPGEHLPPWLAALVLCLALTLNGCSAPEGQQAGRAGQAGQTGAATTQPSRGERKLKQALLTARAAMEGGLEPAELAVYHQAVEKAVRYWQGLDAEERATSTRLQTRAPERALFDDLELSSEISVHELQQRVAVRGVGVPLVATWKSTDERRQQHPLLSEGGYAQPLTATLEFPAQGPAALVLRDPRETPAAWVGGHYYQVAADYSAPGQVELGKRGIRMPILGALFHSADYLDQLGLIALEPPKRDKIPVIFVHGLISRPATWSKMVNELTASPELRQHFQFYFFRYPTGVPVLYSAAKMRDQLAVLWDELRRVGNPHACDMILVGHSMGGLISKTQVQSSGDAFWISQLGAPPDELRMRPAVREVLAPHLEFEPNPCIDRIIFIATPHRGSKIADFRLVVLLSRELIKLPLTILGNTFEMLLLQAPDDPAIARLSREGVPSSIDNLSPESPFMRISTGLPIAPSVHLHSIVGNRRDVPLTDPRAGDGVVPYTSAHLEAAQSEVVVRSGHGVHEMPQAVEEIRRILLRHLARE